MMPTHTRARHAAALRRVSAYRDGPRRDTVAEVGDELHALQRANDALREDIARMREAADAPRAMRPFARGLAVGLTISIVGLCIAAGLALFVVLTVPIPGG
jgi:hypothetical protein